MTHLKFQIWLRKLQYFGEVDAKESMLEDQRSGEDQTQLQKVIVQEDTVSHSPTLDSTNLYRILSSFNLNL